MDRYLNNCYKAAQATASKAAARSRTANREQCGSGSQKDPIPEIGATNLLDLPLGVKLPVVPGSNNVFYTTNLSEKLYKPSYDFNLSDPYCRLLETGYKSLHDPHLKSYYRRKDILRRLKKGGYITSNNKVVCTLKELNKYRQYLTSLKLDSERNYVREQEMIEKQVNKLYKTKTACDSHGSTQFQGWLLQENKQTTPDQELLIKQRNLDMTSLELNKLEHTAEKQNVLRIKEEERRHRDHVRRKLSLWRQIEEEWKTKEMLLLSKIGEEVNRELRFEEQRKKVKEDAHRKKQAQLEKKITYYLQKMQRNYLQREGSEENVFANRSQDETEGERETMKDKGPSQHLYSSVKTPERRSTLLHSPHDVKSNTTEQKKDRETIRTSYPSNDGEITTLQSPGVSAKTPSICRYCLQDTSKQQVTRADLNGEKAKKSSLNYEPAPGVSFIHDSPIRQDYHPNRCQEKVTSEELNSRIQNVMTWVVAAVTSVLYPAITKYEERLQNITCPMPDNSTLSSDSASCCSSCCETFLYETSKMVQAEPCTEAADRSIEQPVAPSKSSLARKERTDVETTYHRKEHLEDKPKAPKPEYNEISESANLKTCKSDSHLVVRIETGTRKCKDETDSLECPLSSDEKAKAINEMQELNNVYVNFKHHLKEEAELILRNVFQEMVSELTQTIPTLSSVTTEPLPAQTDTDKGDLLSNVDISSAAAEIMENVLGKLQSAVKKTCTEEFSPGNVSVHFKSD
ncbi:fibrous sheath-interacting protein 2-like isoform X3 [Bubalus kerabau]|uniref:fibrous sheath-interacting protein 2-like isoform X3 n=1 Tax=Bubalus carabanensis TaxID=3119969 RepID=UPI00244ECBE8|nr:fibrous sheath-interacting protein 2-like isoform X3 [Bubalus carabanensis]